MKLAKFLIILSLFILFLITFYTWYLSYQAKYSSMVSSPTALPYFKVNTDISHERERKYDASKEQWKHSDSITLAVVCCGERVEETYTMIKSAVALTQAKLTIELFTEAKLMPFFNSMIAKWPKHIQQRVKMKLNLANYPPGIDDKTWRNLFRECASIRLFLPTLLKDVDSLIYVDTDVVFLAPLDDLWAHFGRMNSSQMVGLAPEHEDPATGWYNRFAKHPYYGKLGVNSGVMLMNLTRLRSFGWEVYMVPVEKEFRSKLSWGDQDIINIIFHYHPDKLYLMGCEYNYRPDHCMYMNMCKAINKEGVYALHGSRKVFHNEKHPAFKIIYSTWNKYELNNDLRQNFYYPISKFYIEYGSDSSCGKLGKLFLKNIEQLIAL